MINADKIPVGLIFSSSWTFFNYFQNHHVRMNFSKLTLNLAIISNNLRKNGGLDFLIFWGFQKFFGGGWRPTFLDFIFWWWLGFDFYPFDFLFSVIFTSKMYWYTSQRLSTSSRSNSWSAEVWSLGNFRLTKQWQI